MRFNFRHFVVVIGNDQGASMDIFNSIKMAFETNDLLAQDFPEVCYPVAALEGIANRCAGQLCQGMNTHIRWTDTLVFPTVPGSEIAGNAITTTSITGRIRGISLATADGRSIRPDFVIIDDPQTFESARSLSQVSQRLSIIQGDICGLSGPGTKITAVMPCTVIRPNDLADQLLDRREHPEWHGRRYGLLDGFPEHLPLWQRYWEIRSREMRNDDRLHEESNRFYALNRTQMDEGAEATWQENFDADEVSAVQHAMDIYFQNKSAFCAEYQNDPQAADLGGEEQLTEEDVLSCMDGLPRGFVPSDTARLTMAVDVQANVLYWLVLATSQDFTARVVDYGVYPPQFQQVFDTRSLHRQLEFHRNRAVTVIVHRHDSLAVQHPGVGVALGGQRQLLELAPAQLGTLRFQPAQCGIDAGDRVRLLGVGVVGQLEAGAERPVAAPLFFALDAKFRAIIDGRNAPKRIY